MKRLFWFLWLILASCGDDPSTQDSGNQAMPVQVASPVREEVALTRVFTGRFVPVEQVEIRARVSGYLQSVHFTEGAEITKGDLMFLIDPDLFDAEVLRSQAILEQAEATEVLAKGKLERVRDLVSRNAVSREEQETRASEYARAKADVQAAKAQLKVAELNRSYTKITAPISGITSSVEITAGNYISGGNPSAEVLTTIIPHSPIYCEFEVDEQQVLEFTRLYFEGKTDGRGGEQPEVGIALADSDEFDFKGRLSFGDNRLDESTATMRLRVTLANENQFLTPGLFARVRVPIGEPAELMLVRDAALGFDQSKRFAWVVKDDGSLERRYVETGQLHGEMRVVEGGLVEDERIAISGIQLLRPGATVEPIPAEMKQAKP
ncbi:MAG: efflux RND transporter periplasmic adaptor subunit [Verrucomicrobiota bacterium]